MDDRRDHRESLEDEATHATEARVILPGIQAIMGIQLIAVINWSFETLTPGHQRIHPVAFSWSCLPWAG